MAPLQIIMVFCKFAHIGVVISNNFYNGKNSPDNHLFETEHHPKMQTFNCTLVRAEFIQKKLRPSNVHGQFLSESCTNHGKII